MHGGRSGIGIIGKLFLWNSLLISIFYGTLVVLYLEVNHMMHLSDEIIHKRQKISMLTKKMIENLLSMEENEKKYILLKNDDYYRFFISARTEFESGLDAVVSLESSDFTLPEIWRQIAAEYDSLCSGRRPSSGDTAWIDEQTIGRWIGSLKQAQIDNEQQIARANFELNRWGQRAVLHGFIGLGVSIGAGMIWIFFVARTMMRPLRALLGGIRSIADDRFTRPVEVQSGDEFGELARAFNDMTKRLNEEQQMRAEFITTLSHEIRTPLTSIRESVNLIAENVMGPTNDRQAKFLKIASAEIGRICELLNRLMHVSRLEENVFRIHPVPADPLEFVIKSIDHLEPKARSKGIYIDLRVNCSLAKIMGDAKHLQQVMFNLLENAIKFSKPGGRIEVEVDPDKEGSLVRYCVADNGCGIWPSEQKSIFNKYFRGRQARRHVDGVGLGLNISKQIIAAHGGRIWVESRPGQGSRFFFTLPAASEAGTPGTKECQQTADGQAGDDD